MDSLLGAPLPDTPGTTPSPSLSTPRVSSTDSTLQQQQLYPSSSGSSSSSNGGSLPPSSSSSATAMSGTLFPMDGLGASPRLLPSMPGLYSVSGLDILLFLDKVIHRPNPTIQLGPVDLSCSFSISDLSQQDCPIVYVSEKFELTTGYSNTDIIGQNCRFLQAPDGQVKKGSVRQYSDNNVISHMKACIDARKESQFSLVNYKKSGEPFINLVTVIPVCYYEEGRVSHFIGFQIDLVKQPDCIMQRMRDGTYAVNYQSKTPPPPPLPTIYQDESVDKEIVKELLYPSFNATTTVGHNSNNNMDNSNINNSNNSNEQRQQQQQQHSYSSSGSGSLSTSNKRPFAHSTFIDNCGDFVFILSIRGLFLYASPKACQELLGYTANEVLGRNLSEFMHPTDDTFVTRILRHAAPNQNINMICRLKRKDGGFVYAELRGHVYQGQSGKRTRCIVMSGRQTKVGSLLTKDILAPSHGIPESWAKVSLEGLFLYTCPSTPDVFNGLSPDDLYAHSLFEFVALKDHDRLLHAMEYVAHSSRFYDVQRLTMTMSPSSPPVLVHIRLYNDGAADSATNHLYCQFKLLTDPSTGATYPVVDMRTMADFSRSFQGGNLFDFMTNDKSPPIHFEINNLRIQNKKLREELERVQRESGHSPKRQKLSN